MDPVVISVILVVGLALLFDFTNGFHDAANAISTTVATRAMKPRHAVILAAVFNFLPALLGSTLVASTIAKVVDVDALGDAAAGAIPLGVEVTWAALIAAITWNYFTWWFGLPSSSSHALIGGLVGAGLAAGGASVVNWDEVEVVAVAIVVSPAVAFTVAWLAFRLVRLLQRAAHLDDDHEVFRWGQIVSASWVSWGHGSNDAQKTMGIIAATLGAAGFISADDSGSFLPPTWVILSSAAMISFGTYWGGWAIIDTLGLKITRLTRASGFGANLGATAAIFGATQSGIPISTTHAAATSIMGAGVSSRRRIDWTVMRDMVIAWVLTLPAVGLVGYVVFQITLIEAPGSWLAAIFLMAALGTWATWLMRHAENADDVDERVAAATDETELATTPPHGPAGHGTGEHHLHGPAGHGGPPPRHTEA